MIEIENYLFSILLPKLKGLIDDDLVIQKVLSDIKTRLISVIKKWNEKEFISTLLFLGFEEATFYRPKTDSKIRSFVVVTIRNSIIEDLSSTDESAMKFGLSKPPITDKDIIDIAKSAIEYFSEIQMDKISLNLNSDDDVYSILPIRYPVAWEALGQLSNLTLENKVMSEYKPIVMKEITLRELKKERGFTKERLEGKERYTIVQSGMDATIDASTMEIMREIKTNRVPFFSDSFKGISRNPDKLLHIIEFVLRLRLPVVTMNYYMENGVVSKRKKLLKPFHSPKDTIEKLNGYQHKDCTEKHRNVLVAMAKSIQ